MKIVMVGLGAMGSWLAETLQKRNELWVWDSNPQCYSNPKKFRFLNSMDEIANLTPEMLINSVNLAQTTAVFDALVPKLPRDTILTDMASVKADLAQHYARWNLPFLSIHPLFGPLFESIDSQPLKTILLMKESNARGSAWLRNQFREPEYRIREMGFEAHDQAMVHTLGLPALLSILGLMLLNPQAPVGSGLAAFLDHSRKRLNESPDLIQAVLNLALYSDLPHRIRESLDNFLKTEPIRGEAGCLLEQLKNKIQKLDMP